MEKINSNINMSEEVQERALRIIQDLNWIITHEPDEFPTLALSFCGLYEAVNGKEESLFIADEGGVQEVLVHTDDQKIIKILQDYYGSEG